MNPTHDIAAGSCSAATRTNTGALKNSQSFPRGDLLERAKAADKAHDRILELQRKNL
jgi:hypothetical protein